MWCCRFGVLVYLLGLWTLCIWLVFGGWWVRRLLIAVIVGLGVLSGSFKFLLGVLCCFLVFVCKKVLKLVFGVV